MRKRDTETLLTSMVSAALASAITYFLYGTDKGEMTRRRIKGAARKARDKAEHLKDTTLESGALLWDTAKLEYENLAELLNEKKGVLKNLEREDLEWLKERFKERMAEVWEETHDDIEEVLDDASK